MYDERITIKIPFSSSSNLFVMTQPKGEIFYLCPKDPLIVKWLISLWDEESQIFIKLINESPNFCFEAETFDSGQFTITSTMYQPCGNSFSLYAGRYKLINIEDKFATGSFLIIASVNENPVSVQISDLSCEK